MLGFGCQILAYDINPNADLEAAGVKYVTMSELLPRAHILSLHCPLLPSTRHLLNADTFPMLPVGAIVVNTSRGALIDAQAAIQSIKCGGGALF